VAAALVTTLAAQVASLPVSAAHFGRLPGLGLLSNALVLPLQPIQMMAALVAAVTAAISTSVATATAVPAWALARVTLSIAHGAASLPLATLESPAWAPPGVVAYYGLLLLAVSGSWRNLRRRLDALRAWRPARQLPVWGSAVVAVAAVWAVALQLPDGRLHVAFLDVGQGDAILITSPSGRRVLVDGGPDPDVLRGHLGRALPFWQRHLDVVALTHPDMDHMGGLLGLAPRYSVGLLLGSAAPVPEAWRGQWQDQAARASQVRTAEAGQILDLGDGVTLRVLYPLPGGCRGWESSDNDCSTVLQVSYGSATILLTGDAEGVVEGLLLAQGAVEPAWLLKVSHHGSGRATGDALLEALQPRLAVISVGDNRYGHPSPQVLERLRIRGIQCLRTDQLGTIEVLTDGENYSIRLQ
jgi:competence protein ComEC